MKRKSELWSLTAREQCQHLQRKVRDVLTKANKVKRNATRESEKIKRFLYLPEKELAKRPPPYSAPRVARIVTLGVTPIWGAGITAL